MDAGIVIAVAGAGVAAILLGTRQDDSTGTPNKPPRGTPPTPTPFPIPKLPPAATAPPPPVYGPPLPPNYPEQPPTPPPTGADGQIPPARREQEKPTNWFSGLWAFTSLDLTIAQTNTYFQFLHLGNGGHYWLAVDVFQGEDWPFFRRQQKIGSALAYIEIPAVAEWSYFYFDIFPVLIGDWLLFGLGIDSTLHLDVKLSILNPDYSKVIAKAECRDAVIYYGGS